MIFAVSKSETSKDKLRSISGADANRGEQEAYQLSIPQVLSALHVDTHLGLSAGEAKERLKRYGRNELAGEKPIPAWRKFLRQFTDVLVVLLLVAGLVSMLLWLYEHDAALPYEALASSPS